MAFLKWLACETFEYMRRLIKPLSINSPILYTRIYHYIKKDSVYISKMWYYVHYLHSSNYCPHLCRYVYLNVLVVVRFGLLQVVGMSNLTLYFAYQGRLFYVHEPCFMDVSYQLSPVNFHSESSPLPSPGIELALFGYVTGSDNAFIHSIMCPWGHMVQWI